MMKTHAQSISKLLGAYLRIDNLLQKSWICAISRFFSANSGAILLKKPKNSPKSSFPSLQFLFSVKVIVCTVFLLYGSFGFAKNSSLSLEQASKQIQTQSQGKILSAKTLHDNHQHTHRIKVLLPSGRIKVYKLPATVPNNQPQVEKKYNNNYQRPRSNSYYNQHDNKPSHNSNSTHRTINQRPAHQTSAPRNREKQK